MQANHARERLLVAVFGLLAAAGVACGGHETEATPDDPPPPDPVVDAGPPDVAPPPVDAGQDADTSMRGWKPNAKGLWIWTFENAGMTPAQAATLAKKLGIAYVLIKSGQDKSFWPQRFNEAAVGEFTSRGIRVLAWPYITPAGGAGAIDAAVAAANVKGCDGLVLDVEIEWEKADYSAAAKSLCDGIRAKAPGVWLAYTSFGWPGLHPKFPWTTFDSACGDGQFPQIYYSDRGIAWDSALKQSLDQIATLKLKAPIWPITSNDDIAGTTAGPTTASLNSFFDAAGAFTSLWVLPPSTEPTKLTQLNELHWSNP